MITLSRGEFVDRARAIFAEQQGRPMLPDEFDLLWHKMGGTAELRLPPAMLRATSTVRAEMYDRNGDSETAAFYRESAAMYQQLAERDAAREAR